MKKKRLLLRTIILLVLASALGYTLYANFFTSKEKVKVGSTAPNFLLKDLEGNEYELESYRGKGVFLNFWGTYCKPCEREMPYMENQYKQFKDQGVEILAINVDEAPIVIQKFVDRYNLTFPVPVDKGTQVLNAYGVKPIPTTFLIDKNGKVVDIISGSMTEKMVYEHMNRIKP
ncbi:peroxiredoxin [Bacillus mesophilus]|uniref:Thiol-disulfide oxidoreductase ResA n=1 Tax=Bacillus mesophilus TaxID=1808955 RepID=A0A6M0Q4I4_9BACI|nr:thiol-disulfide oxidoreductase ResA [Bacillus mesophilus]MBM7661177.1 peroxiredoxin [Bacillus mesophilus]NEY71296.1 thiol-disulfide oxidoreductase ResA [Bacillus mesophilus]